MSRFIKRTENEPLLRLERPTLASSQTTAHIINSCFNEVLSQRQQMDSGAINNMAVSRRGDPSLYHDSFVEEAKQVSDHYQRRLEELLNVERHLLQAKAKALAEDERNLTQSATDLTSHEVVLPQGPSQFRKQLNEELLSRHCLLSPSQYLPQPLAPRDAPKEGPPSYLQSTYTWTQHALVTDGTENQGSFDLRKKKQSLQPIWREALSQEEREAEKNRLARLERKAGYLKNPKCSQSALNNTASSGPMKLKLQQQTDSGGDCKDVLQMFVAEPSEVVFTDYQINQTYEATVVLKNVSGASRQLRVIPLDSPFFKVQTGYFPSSEGLIAPGMYCSYVVRFTPDSLTNYEGQLLVQCNNGEVLTVPLRAFRPPPDLSLPQELDCGHCLAGDTKTVLMKCDNFGGEGSFKLLPVDNTPQETKQLSDCLHLGPFSLSPTEFCLSRGGSVEFTAVFSPPAVGWYSEPLTMACDNGQMLTFTLKGGADLITLGPTYTGYSSPEEITTYHTYAKSTGGSNGELHGHLSDSFSKDQEVVIEKLEWPSLEVAPTYPCKPAYSTVTIHNFSEVDLPFTWQFYRPVGCPLQVHEDVPVIKQLIRTSETLFAVQPSSGILYARKSQSFIYEFLPQSIGEFVDVAHLVLSGVHTDLSLDPSKAGREWLRLSDSEVSIAHIELNGVCEPYSIELEPCSFVLRDELPPAVEVRKTFQMSNKSLSDVSYKWDCYEKDGVSVSVEPAIGQLESDESVSSEVVLQADKAGPFSAQLHCLLEHSLESLSMLVEGCVQAPIVKVSVVNLDFGLIQFGRSASLKFDLVNESHCPVSFTLKQLVKEKKIFMDHSCLTFIPSNEGTLEPLSSTTVTVECQPLQTGQLRSIVQLLLDNQQPRYIAVIAEVQRPKVTLDTAEFQFENAYIDIENQVTTRLINTGLLPCYYSWSSQVYGDGDKHCSVDIQPMTGRIDPGQFTQVSITSTWNKVGSHQALLKCDVINVESPLFLSLTSQVHGLAVSYRIARPHPDGPIRSESTPEGIQCELALEFGGDNKLGEPVVLDLEISNPTTIHTSYEACVSYFPAAKPPTPPAQPMPGPNLLNANRSRGRYLLNRTVNTADPKSKSQHQATLDYASALLCDGRGACFSVNPCSGSLPPSSTAVVKVTAYSNMWGQYSDQLLCKITGLETKVLPISYGVKGCPIVFQTTATSGYTLCRLGSHLPDAKTVVRVLKLKNTSPMTLRVDWRMRSILQEDNKIVDLITFIGDPFPKTSFLMDSSGDTVQTDHLINTSSRDNSEEVETKSLNESGTGESSPCLNDLTVDGCEPLIGALIKPHEGVSSNDPFDIHPKQITLPPHGHSTVQLSFQPSIKALNELGSHLASYADGYISLDEESPINVKRLSGYDVEPLRIDILAAIEHPKLMLECDEDSGLEFSCPASLLLEDNKKLKEEAVVSHHVTLVNRGVSTVSINLSIEERHFRVTGLEHANNSKKEFTTLQPCDSVHFNLMFSFSCQDVRRNKLSPKSTLLEYSTSLCVEFSTGAKQLFPVSAAVALPGLSVSPVQLDFGICHLGSSVSLSLLLLNNNPVAALWSIEVLDAELQHLLQVSDESGQIPAPLVETGPTSHLLQVTFTPSEEKEYTGNLSLKELITGGVLCIRVYGRGSADEQHLR